MGSTHWLDRCTFALRPLSAKEDPRMNCYNTFQPYTPPGTPVITMTTTLKPIKTTPTTRPTTAPTPHKPEGKMKSKIEVEVQGDANRAFYFDALNALSFFSGPCLHFRFLNKASVPIILYSSLKPEGYLVKGRMLRLRYVIHAGQVVGLQRRSFRRGRRQNDEGVLSEVSSKIPSLTFC